MATYEEKLVQQLIDGAINLSLVASELNGCRRRKEEQKHFNYNDSDSSFGRIVKFFSPAYSLKHSTTSKTFDNNNLIAAKEGTLPPKYADGGFRQKGDIFEYRFIYKSKRISLYGKSKQECFDKRTAIISGQDKQLSKNILIFAKWIKEWFELYKTKNGESSKKYISYYINNVIIPAVGHYPLNKIDGVALQKLLNKYSTKPNTQKKIAQIINGSLKKAMKLGKIKFNPFEACELDQYKPQSYRCLTFSEQRLILDNISSQYRPIFLFACCTGIRIGRILELKLSDFVFNKKEIIVFKKQRKGLTETYTVPFIDKLISFCPLPQSGLIFDGLTYNAVKKYFQGLYAKLGIKKANIHTFRHTFISLCYHAEVPPKQIQNWAGHATFEVTMNNYTHIIKSGNSEIFDYIKELKTETR